MTHTFPTKFASKGHFGCQLEEVIDLSGEGDLVRFLGHGLDSARTGTRMISAIREKFGSDEDAMPEEARKLLETLNNPERNPLPSGGGKRVATAMS
jgi:hypothetical protein